MSRKAIKGHIFQLSFILILIPDTGKTKTVQINFSTAFFKATKIISKIQDESDNDQAMFFVF